MNGARRLSSDTSAKINTIAVVLIVAAAGMGSFLVAYSLLNNNEKSYTITVTVEGIEVACTGNSVYNVIHQTATGNFYYDPETKEFSRLYSLGPSNIAFLYPSVTIGNVTESPQNSFKRTVQSPSDPVNYETVEENSIVFKISSTEDSVDMRVFLMIEGNDKKSNGTVADIYESTPGMAGVIFQLNLEKGSITKELHGNAKSEIIGHLNLKIAVQVN